VTSSSLPTHGNNSQREAVNRKIRESWFLPANIEDFGDYFLDSPGFRRWPGGKRPGMSAEDRRRKRKADPAPSACGGWPRKLHDCNLRFADSYSMLS